jgi:hypothetical protein
MRGHDIHGRGARRIRSDHRQTAIDEFHHRILRDGVHDDIVEDAQLAHLEDAIAKLEDTRDRRRRELETDADPAQAVVDAIEDLQETARERVMEVCAMRARIVLVDGDVWVQEGYEDEADVEAAKREAATWLVANDDVTKRTFGGMDEAVSEEVDASE